MDDLLSSSAWALESKYYGMAKERILARIGKGLPALSAAEAKPRKYAHADAEGYPTMWVSQAGELAGMPTPAGHGLNLATSMAAALAGPRGGSSANTSGSKVAVIPVQGTIQKRGGYCSLGTKDMMSMLSAALRDPEISAIVLDIDSPGGQVDGTEEFAQALANASKPVVSYIDGLGASAAYWIAAQTAYIYINSASTGYAGSLGVLCMNIFQGAYLEKQGFKVEILRSTRAVDKARMNGVEELTDAVRASVQADLDQIGETFIAAVERGRAGKLSTKEDVFTGKVYRGIDAKKHGLVDAIGSLQDAVNKAAQLAQSGAGAGNSASSFTQNFNNAWKANSLTS
ncbi:S49 family peptidase [Hymenobacter sp. BT683]|uniref:S49 family peptidase n=1 Tax=Hymenobacter jeongseonensis TaxID=2791027 RepID=A0ABS0IMN2_9BACT|nr:S49 family peptidase [Hymenobacter jeongseonensis]MBF9239472.1 S49 family peptidase [Hymenobacter jeongseonensis]